MCGGSLVVRHLVANEDHAGADPVHRSSDTMGLGKCQIDCREKIKNKAGLV